MIRDQTCWYVATHWVSVYMGVHLSISDLLTFPLLMPDVPSAHASDIEGFNLAAYFLSAHFGGSSLPSSSALSPSSLVLCTDLGLCSAGAYTVNRHRGVGPVLMTDRGQPRPTQDHK